jgi:hypothetical protein
LPLRSHSAGLVARLPINIPDAHLVLVPAGQRDRPERARRRFLPANLLPHVLVLTPIFRLVRVCLELDQLRGSPLDDLAIRRWPVILVLDAEHLPDG